MGIPLLFILIGLGAIGSRYYKVIFWNDNLAVVTMSEAYSYRNDDRQRLYTANIEYRYEVDGKEHLGNFATSGSNLSWTADRIASHYIRGEMVQIKVNPSNASASTLPEKPPLFWYFFVLLPGIVLGIFLYVGFKIGWLGTANSP